MELKPSFNDVENEARGLSQRESLESMIERDAFTERDPKRKQSSRMNKGKKQIRGHYW